MPRCAQPLPHRHEKQAEDRFWYRWSRSIQHRPWPFLVGGVLVLAALALPLFSIRLGFGDTGNLKEEQTARRAYDLLAEGFGPGSNGRSSSCPPIRPPRPSRWPPSTRR